MCRDGLISAAECLLRVAVDESESLELKQKITEVLEQFRGLRRLAVKEALAKKDREDGIANTN